MRIKIKFIIMQGLLIAAITVMQILVFNGEALFIKDSGWFYFFQFYLAPWYYCSLAVLSIFAAFEIFWHKEFINSLIITQCAGTACSVFFYVERLITYEGRDISGYLERFIFTPYLIITAVSIVLWFTLLFLKRKGIIHIKAKL